MGHLAVAQHALDTLELDTVLLMPANMPPHKFSAEDPGSAHRLAMCRLAAQDATGVAVCALEIERGGPSYTVDTLRSIHASHPHAELTFIVGADTASTLPSWREPRELLDLAGLAVAARGGWARTKVIETVTRLRGPQLAGALPSGASPVRFLQMPEIDVSSSLVRERAAAGEPIESLVGAAVARYIHEHGLYRAEVPAQARA
jgi:nicotinate-nucleotide adenylyltransferase